MNRKRAFYQLNTCCILSILLFTLSCTSKNAEDEMPQPAVCDTTDLSFANDIFPLLQQKCALSGCHTASGMAGGYVYESYNGFMQAVGNNRVLGAINHEPGYTPMPNNLPKLSDCEISKITRWIENGALDN